MSLYTTPEIQATNIYTAQATGTKAEVTDTAESTVYMFDITNGTAAIAYLQVFDLDADAVTVGTTAPTYAFGCAAGASKCIMLPKPIKHSTGFTIASTTTRTGAVSAAQEVTIIYG